MGLLDSIFKMILGNDHMKEANKYVERYKDSKYEWELQDIINDPNSSIYEKQAAKAVISTKQYRQ